MSDLQPCPFCGSESVTLVSMTVSMSYVKCWNCRAEGPDSDGDDKDAKAAYLWNTRAGGTD